jgi:hypothetical protein
VRLQDIQKIPTCVDAIPAGAKGVHESVLRAYQILERVKDYLRRGVPGDVTLELIKEMEGDQ